MNFKNKNKIILFLVILSLIVIYNILSYSNNNLLNIHMLDVGQGDSILIITPNNKTILIDAGEAKSGPQVVSYLRRNKIKEIDILIATHPHSDHIGGIPSIMENFKINSFYMPPVVHTTKTFENMLQTAQNKGIKISPLSIGNKIEFEENIDLYFLGPLKNYGNNLNLWSIVLKLDYNNKSFLFTGDLEHEAEIDIINHYSPQFLRSHLLKVGHHGSNSSTSDDFLNIIKPHVALISCGIDNSYNHPHKEVLDRLTKRGVHIYRTDHQGTVIIKSDGEEIWSHRKPYSSPSY